MRKIFLLLMALTMLFVPTMAYAGGQPSQNASSESENVINRELENINDEARKSKIEELMNTPICYVVYIEGEEFSDFERPQYDSVELINHLADLPDDEFDAEAKQLVDQIVIANKSNNNIIWTKEFKNAVIEEYCPQYQNQLQTKLLAEPSYNMEMNYVSKAANGSGQDTKTAVAKCEAFGNELFRMSCKVTWSWGDNKLKSVKATPSYQIKSARYTFEDYSHPLDITKDSISAQIYVKGHFIESIAPGINFLHHYASLSISVNKNGEFASYPVIE